MFDTKILDYVFIYHHIIIIVSRHQNETFMQIYDLCLSLCFDLKGAYYDIHVPRYIEDNHSFPLHAYQMYLHTCIT